MKRLVLLLFFLPSVAFAERLEDVRLLNTKPGPDNVEVQLQAKQGPPEVLSKRPGSSEPVELWAADAALTMDFIA